LLTIHAFVVCASPVLLDFFRPAAYNQIRSNQGYLPIRWLSFQKYFIFDEQISGKGYPLLTVGNSLFSTSKSVNTSIVFIGITPFLFSERTTTRLSLSRSDLIRFSIAYHRLFYYLFDIQIPSRNSSTRGDSFLSDKVVCNLIIIVFCHAEYITHTIVHMFPGCCIIIILI